MRPSTLCSLIATLAGGAFPGGTLRAQVPNGRVLITHRETVSQISTVKLTILEPASGALTPLRAGGVSIGSLQKGFVVNPGDGTQIWTNPGFSLVGSISMQSVTLAGSSLVTSQTYSITGVGTSAARYVVVGPDLYLANATTGAAGGVYKVAIGTKTGTQVAALPKANAMAALGSKLYVADYASGTPSTIVELDLVTLVQRTVGTGYVALRGLTTFQGGLLAGNDNGDLVAISVTTGAAALLSAPGKGAIVSVVADGAVGLPVFATANAQVWRFPIYTAPLFTSGTGVLELSPGRQPVAAALAFGTSCAGTPSGLASFVFSGYPSIPSPAFQLQLANLKPTTPGSLALGASRTSLGALPLPFDLAPLNMAGCWLYQDLLVGIGFVSDAAGMGNVPLPIPNTPALAGARVVGQGYVFDPAQNPIGITTEGYELILN